MLGVFGGVIVLIAMGAFVVLGGRSQTSSKQPSSAQTTDQTIPTIKPEDIGLVFSATADKKYVKFVINKPDGIDSIDYDISYDAISDDGQTVNQGLTGQLSKSDVQNSVLQTKNRELGTCSTGGKCRFDKGVKAVKLLLKITKNDGKVYQCEQNLML